MKLHEAICVVIQTAGTPLKATDIANRVNRLRLYTRGDLQPLPGSQVHARVKNYPGLFVKGPDGIRLTERGVEVARENAPRHEATRREATNTTANGQEAASTGGDTDFPLEMDRFRALGTVGQCMRAGLPRASWLNQGGCYAILSPTDYRLALLSDDAVREHRNVISPWPAERLRKKWVDATRVVYIGLAGKSLRTRLGQLLRHAAGKTNDRGPHKGGEILWQLDGYEAFTIVASPTGPAEPPRTIEARYLGAFRDRHQSWPFANRKG